MSVSFRLTRGNIVSAQTQGSHPAIIWKLFRRCEIGLARHMQTIRKRIYEIYVISYLIPIFVGLVVYTLIDRDFSVINLNGKYPKIFVTNFRYIWN